MAETSNEKLVQRLRKYEKEARETAANCEVVAAALAGQIEALEARTGHNIYAVRLAVDHRNSAKRETQFADDIAAVLSRMCGPGEVVVPKEPTEAMTYAGIAALDKAHADLENYKSGVTKDWDTGMIANAVYAAMLAARPNNGGTDGVR